MLYVIEMYYKDEVVIHRINYDEGVYLMPRVLRMRNYGSLRDVAKHIVHLVALEDDVTKIIFERYDACRWLRHEFDDIIENLTNSIKIDEKGNVIRND